MTNNNDEESTFIRADSLRSSSILRLADILSQNILLHPFISLRRTCQVNRKCSPFICIQPFSLIPFMYHQQRKQGLSALYKGLSSELLVKGIALGSETAIANYTEWPREVSQKRCIQDSFKVLALRGLSVALSTPFLCTSVIETVQSVIVVKDRPSFVDCLRDGFLRLLHLRSTPSARMLPIWLLIVPTAFYHVSHMALWHLARKSIEFLKINLFTKSKRNPKSSRLNRTIPEHSMTDESTWQADLTSSLCAGDTSFGSTCLEKDNHEISVEIAAALIADITLLPIQSVLHSLYVQGTRTIIDNCDETTVVLPVLTNYDGFTDCYQSILKFEGCLGLYKGLGAVILQYSVQFLLFRSLYYLLREFQTRNDSNKSYAPRRTSAKPQAVDNRAEHEFARYMETNRHSTPNSQFKGKIDLTPADCVFDRNFDHQNIERRCWFEQA